MGAYVQNMKMAVLPECFCFVFSLVQHVAAFHCHWHIYFLQPGQAV
jgi:hypothetical protein